VLKKYSLLARLQCSTIVMVRSLKIMRAYKVARQRRPMSPAQYQSALKAALDTIPGICGYHWRKIFCNRGHASVSIIVLLGCGFRTAAAAEAAVKLMFRELEDMFSNMAVVVTYSSRSFWNMRAEISPEFSRPLPPPPPPPPPPPV
jgi:hypothetical protein